MTLLIASQLFPKNENCSEAIVTTPSLGESSSLDLSYAERAEIATRGSRIAPDQRFTMWRNLAAVALTAFGLGGCHGRSASPTGPSPVQNVNPGDRLGWDQRISGE